MSDDNLSKYGYDFGNDADVVLPDDPNFDAWIAQQAPSLNDPPATPRVDMWDAIQARLETTQAAQAGAIAGVTPLRRRRWVLPAVIAAALLVGIGVDRYSLRSVPSAPSSQVAAADAPAPVFGPRPPEARPTAKSAPATAPAAQVNDPSRLYRLAAVQTLSQAEALLTAYRASNIAERNPAAAKQLGVWGRDVLSSTRLLLDSPAGDDAELRPLLDDLELVLVQIIRVSGAPLDESERALIDRAMRERDLLPRIRSAVPAGVAGAASE
ncbi:MAG: hypothetical protein V4550_05150 [Gemmatimonadota bacterium]